MNQTNEKKFPTIEQIQKIETLFGNYPILTGYLFGSQVTGDVNPDSDIDIGIYFEQTTTQVERGEFRLRLIVELERIIEIHQVDLVVMNDVPVDLQYEIISANTYLYIRDESARVAYETQTTSMYFDQKYYIDRHNKKVLEQIAQDGIL